MTVEGVWLRWSLVTALCLLTTVACGSALANSDMAVDATGDRERCNAYPLIAGARRALAESRIESAMLDLEKALTAHASDCEPGILELQGEAFIRAGRRAEALAIWTTHLERYSTHPTAVRVRQRLVVAQASAVTVRAPTRASTAQKEPGDPVGSRPHASRWHMDTVFTQDYWALSSSWSERTRGRAALLSVLDTRADFRGDRYRVTSDLMLGYQHSLQGPATAMDNDLLGYEAALGIRSVDDRWGLRAGRQTSYRDGIGGRFSGLSADLLLADRWRLNVAAGAPVDAPRYSPDSARRFVAASLELPKFVHGLEASGYVHVAQIDGLLDRKSVGARAAFGRDKVQLFGEIDYDLSYGVLNSATLQTNVLWSARLQSWLRARAYAWPRLATRNALIGQDVATVDALLNFYTQRQLRTLAQNRTGNALELGGGFRWTMSQRWSVQSSVGYVAIRGTVESAGVAAAGDYRAFDASTALHGAGVWRTGALLIATARWSSNRRSDRAIVAVEHRLPFGRWLRIAPRLAIEHQVSGALNGDATVLIPGVRATLKIGRRARIHLAADHGWVREQLDELTGGELFSESERSRELYFNARWELQL